MRKADLVKARAELIARARAFLSSRGLLEVDVPLLVSGAPLDDHIDLFEVSTSEDNVRYLHSSPEYGMKRLLAEGCPDIFQISHVFRKGELGSRHNPEFLMAEWYRVGQSFQFLVDETVAFLQHFLGALPVRQNGYWDLLEQRCGKDVFSASATDCLHILDDHGIQVSESVRNLDLKSLQQLLFSSLVEPALASECMQIVCDFPEDQAALARVVDKQGRRVAQRFEIYVQGLELCNGYDELSDPDEQRKRFEASNQLRLDRGLQPYEIDRRLLSALADLPSCVGVAVGLDRVIQLTLKAPTLAGAQLWSWEES